MARFNEVYALAVNAVPDSVALSFPVPVAKSSRLYDLFFTYSVDMEANLIERPVSCLAVFFDEGRTVDLGDIYGFASIPFTDNVGCQIDGFLDNLFEARGLYERVREEARNGLEGSATKRYAELVRTTSQPCLLPFYEAMGMNLEI